ncbi:hypothetical protein JVT61DRAFT_2684 [Boletus reticuloceps]|uniref:Uncharacterized protein n=1 Tax=Boletus reticuloceps TaxID=495285 RepID=A0A8I3A8J5_9AGAM|nr:hypothetical protein JVT61DRAFT_2684 [Boletus reticuloceps]
MSSSSDLEIGITQIIQKKSKKTKKKRSKPQPRPPTTTPTVIHDRPTGKNEGDDPNWAYKPPKAPSSSTTPSTSDRSNGMLSKMIQTLRFGSSESQIRCIQPKHLQGLEIDSPSSSSSLSSPSRTARIGSLVRKTMSYDVWSIGPSSSSADANADANVAGAEELLGLTPLLPRKRKKGRLYIGKPCLCVSSGLRVPFLYSHLSLPPPPACTRAHAPRSAPKLVVHHIVVSARPPTATLPAPTDIDQPQTVPYRNPPRTSYPKEMLTHAFVPYGARSTQTRSEDVSMDVETESQIMDDTVTQDRHKNKPTSTSDAAPSSEKKKPKSKEHKKRKVEGESPKKSKKHKANA